MAGMEEKPIIKKEEEALPCAYQRIEATDELKHPSDPGWSRPFSLALGVRTHSH